MSQKTGKGDALRKEQGVFAYFCRRMDKSKASGSTQTAGFAFKNSHKRKKDNSSAIRCFTFTSL
jgi:hypothetical protein